MMDKLLALPDDMFKHHLLQYFSMRDICRFEDTIRCHKYRQLFLNKLMNTKLSYNDNNNRSYQVINAITLYWLAKRQLYVIEISLNSTINNNNLNIIMLRKHNIFKYILSLDLISCNNLIDDDIAILSHYASSVTSIYLATDNQHQPQQQHEHTQLTTNSIILISKKCLKLINIHISGNFMNIDYGIISLSLYCNNNIQILMLHKCYDLTDVSLLSISKNCKNLKILFLIFSSKITDESILAISENCLYLENLNVDNLYQLTNQSIFSLAKYSKYLVSLNIRNCIEINDDSIMELVKNCIYLNRLIIYGCQNISMNCIQHMRSIRSSLIIHDII
jgi:hypothetical protein